MTPYYADEAVTLYHGDCRELLPTLPDRSVDAVLTDPPYSENTHKMAKTNRGRGHGVKAVHFDPIAEADLRAVLSDLGRISRGWVVATLDYKHAFRMEESPPPGLRCLRIGVWTKPNPTPQISGDRPGQGWEAIAFLHRDDTKPSWSGGGRSSVWHHPVVQSGQHPTEKPLPMVGEWVRLFTPARGLVLDPFAGSGTTLRAAKDNGRTAIGIERDERYCETTAARLSQGVLDFGAVA